MPSTRALQEVELPSGWKVRGVLPTLPELIRWDLIPHALLNAADHFADPAWFDEATVDPKDLAARQEDQKRITRHMVIAFPRDEWSIESETWEPVELTLDDIAKPPRGIIDHDDVTALVQLVRRDRTPEQVTALSRFVRGLVTAEQVAATVEREAASTVPGLVPFPRKSRRAATGTDSGADGNAPVRAARREGSRGRVRA